MIQLSSALKAWGTPAFPEALKRSIEELDADSLPLQECLTRSDFTTGANRKVKVLNVSDDAGVIRAKTGIFYTGLIADTHCEEDPTRNEEVNEYCEMEFDIDKQTANTEVKLLMSGPND